MRRALMLMGCAVILAACGGEQQSSQTGARSAAYPIDWCVVSDEKLGSMGDPVTVTYQGREIKFCCKYCIDEFNKQPAAYVAKLDSAATGLIKAPAGSGS